MQDMYASLCESNNLGNRQKSAIIIDDFLRRDIPKLRRQWLASDPSNLHPQLGVLPTRIDSPCLLEILPTL